LAESTAPNTAGDELVMYLTDWNDFDSVKKLHDTGAANYVTTLNYAFADVRPAHLTEAESLALDYADYDAEKHGPIVCVPAQPENDFRRAYAAQESINGEADDPKANLKGFVNQIRILKEIHPQIKVVISLGGWLLSKWFSVAASTVAGRKSLIDSSIELWIGGQYEGVDFAGVFDGIDLDWEFPAGADLDPAGNPIPGSQRGHPHNITLAGDVDNYVLLAQEYRAALDEVAGDRHLLLTAATPGTWRGDMGFNYAELAKYMDWFCVMNYDMHGSWNPYVAHGAPFYDFAGPEPVGVVEFVEYLIKSGVPSRKVVLGIPFYGPHWKSVEVGPGGELINQPAAGVGVKTYRDLVALATQRGLEPQWDDHGRGSYFFDAKTREFYSYDSARVIELKGKEIAKRLNLRGMMAWEFDQDTADAELTLTMARALKIPRVPRK